METSLSTLKRAFEAEGFEYAFNVFPSDDGSPALPYVSVMPGAGDIFFADNSNYYTQFDVELDLFMKEFDAAVIDQVVSVLAGLEIPCSWDAIAFSTDERVYQVPFHFRMQA